MKTITHADRLAANIVAADVLGFKQEYIELAHNILDRKAILTAEDYDNFYEAAIQARKDWEVKGLDIEAFKLNQKLAKKYSNEKLLTKFDMTNKYYLMLEININEYEPEHYLSIGVSNMMNDTPYEVFDMNKALAIALKNFFRQLEIV